MRLSICMRIPMLGRVRSLLSRIWFPAIQLKKHVRLQLTLSEN